MHKFDMSERQIKWTIFLFLIALFPAAFFLLFDIPTLPVLIVLLRILPVTIGRGNFEWTMVFFFESLFWSGVFYFLSWLVSRKLSTIRRKLKITFLSVILLVICGLAMFPIYDFNQRTVNIGVTAYFLSFTDKKLF